MLNELKWYKSFELKTLAFNFVETPFEQTYY